MKRLSIVVFALLLLGGCSPHDQIVVDTTGMTPEQAKITGWKVKYAVAMDWLDYTQKSYKTTLDAMSMEDAREFHQKAWPYFEKIDFALKAVSTAIIEGKDPTKDYDTYLALKTELLKLLAKN